MKTAALIVTVLLVLVAAAVTIQPEYFIAQDATVDAHLELQADPWPAPRTWFTLLRMEDGDLVRVPGKVGEFGDPVKVRRAVGGSGHLVE